MAIRSIELQNYRAFRELTSVQVRPLTLVFGENNAGKSSVARVLPSIVNSCRGDTGLAYAPVSIGTWTTTGREFVFSGGSRSKFEIGIGFEIAGEVYKATYEVLNVPEQSTSIISRLRISLPGGSLLDFEWDASSTAPNDSSRTYVARHSADSTIFHLRFLGLLPAAESVAQIRGQEGTGLGALAIALDDLSAKTHWLGPLRHTPDRIERHAPGSYRMSPTGKEATQFLARSFDGNNQLFRNVSSWFETALKHRLEIIEGAFDADELFGIALAPLDAPSLRIPVADTGTGIAQVLPIIVLGELAALGELGAAPVLIFENPELHLHDSVHDDLGRFFAKVANASSSPTIVVETHSESMLLAIQLEVAEGRLPSESVSVNWVRRSDGGASVVENASLDSGGMPSQNWPVDAFATAPELAKKLFSVRQK